VRDAKFNIIGAGGGKSVDKAAMKVRKSAPRYRAAAAVSSGYREKLKAARIVGHKPGNISLTPVKRHDASEITSTRLITVSAETRRHKQIFVMSALFILLSPFSAARARSMVQAISCLARG